MITNRPFVIIESPYAASDKSGKGTNVSFAKRVCRWAVTQGYTPFASHLFFPQFLDDLDPTERQHGIKMGLQIGSSADEVWFCVMKDWDHTPGMKQAFNHWIEVAESRGCRFPVIKFIEFNQSGQPVSEKTIWPRED